jgi:hypothetical protein
MDFTTIPLRDFEIHLHARLCDNTLDRTEFEKFSQIKWNSSHGNWPCDGIKHSIIIVATKSQRKLQISKVVNRPILLIKFKSLLNLVQLRVILFDHLVDSCLEEPQEQTNNQQTRQTATCGPVMSLPVHILKWNRLGEKVEREHYTLNYWKHY